MADSNEMMRDTDFEAAFAEGEPEPGGMDLEGAEEHQEGTANTPAEEAAETAGAPEGVPAAVVIVAEEEPVAVTPSAEVPDTPTEGEEEAAAQAGKPVAAKEGDPLDLSDVPAEDLQKAKSWAGRLKKMEEELKAKLAAATPQAAAPASEQQAAAALETAAAAGGEQAAAAAELQQQVDAGEISAADAVSMLKEDFGDEFVNAVGATAKGAVRDAMKGTSEELAQTKAELQALRDQATRDHFEAIADAHPDFVQVYEDPAFRKWATANGKDQVVEGGSARAINKMLDQYKKAQPAAAPTPAQDAVQAAVKAAPKPTPAKVDQAALDAAEGVRGGGGGVRLPEKPQRSSDDFAKAFDEF